MISPPAIWKVILYFAAAVLALVGIAAWHERSLDLARAEAEIAAQKEIAKGLQDQARAIEDVERKRAQETEKRLDAMRAAASKAKTPEQIVDWIPKQSGFEALKLQVESRRDPSAGPQDDSEKHAAAIVEVSAEDLPKLRDTVERCEECDVRVHSLEQDAASNAERLRLAGQQLTAVERERDAAMRAAKGGGWLTRVKRNAKWFAIGAVAAWGITYVHERTH